VKVYKTRLFAKWAAKEDLSDPKLMDAVDQMEKGILDAKLGAGLCKKRVALDGSGKSGGVRTLIAFRKGDVAFFLYGFAKSARANVNEKEEKALKLLAKTYFGMSDAQIGKAMKVGDLIEMIKEERDGKVDS